MTTFPRPATMSEHAARTLAKLRRVVTARYGALGRDAGMSTAEYAMATLAACAFAAVLYQVVTSAPVASALQKLVERALSGSS